MVKILLSLFYFSFGVGLSTAQNIFPYLSNNKYGLADHTGKLMATPIYDDIATFPEAEVFLVKKGESWGVINKEGKILVDFIMHGEVTKTKDRYSNIFLEKVFKIRLPTDKETFLNTPLYVVRDPGHKCLYYVHADRPGTTPECYISASEISKDLKSGLPPGPVNTGIIKVGTNDGKINFLNAQGLPIFKGGVKDGEAYSANVIAVCNDSLNFALFNIKQQPITGFIYDRVESSEDMQLIRCRQKFMIEGKTQYTYDIYNANGSLILENRKYISGLAGRILEQDSLGYSLRDAKGQVIKTFPGAKLFMSSLDTTNIFITLNNKKGVIDRNGQYLAEPIYDDIHWHNGGHYTFTEGQKAGLFDLNFKPLWSLDSVKLYDEVDGLPLHFIVQHSQSKNQLKGVVSDKGKLIIPIDFRSCIYLKDHNFFVVRKDSLAGIYSTTGGVLFPLQVGDFEFDQNQFTFQSPLSTKVYNEKFELLDTRDRFRTELKVKKKVVTEGPPKDLVCLVNSKGEEVSNGQYSELKRVQEFSSRRWGYLAEKFGYQGFNDLLGEYGQAIIPEGYEFDLKWAQNSIGDQGALIVVNKEDNLAHAHLPRLGLINFQGEWVIPPGKQLIGVIGNELIVVTDIESKEKRLYDRFGHKISDKQYHYFVRASNEGIYHDRILVGKPVDEEAYKTYMQKVTRGIYMGKPDLPFYYGAINTKGEEVIAPKYLKLEEFEQPYSCATGLDNKGETYYAIVDVNGKECLKTKRELQFMVIENDSLAYFSEGNKKGVIDITGNILVEPIYNELQYQRGFFIGKDSTSTYLISRNDPSQRNWLGAEEYWEIEQVHTDFLKVENYSFKKDIGKISHVSFFTKDGKFLSQAFNAGNEITYYNWSIPEGYCAIYDSIGAKPYLMNYKTGIKYKS